MGRATDMLENFYVERAAEKSPRSAAQWDNAIRSSGRLDIVVARYIATSEELAKFVPPEKRTDQADWDRMMEVADVLEVDIVSFFVFASIMLDALARAVSAFGGDARAVSIESHHDLTKHLPRYAVAIGLEPPDPRLLQLAQELYERVIETRNKVFVHPDTWRQTLGGFSMGSQGLGTMGLSIVGNFESPVGKKVFQRAKHLHTPVPAFVAEIESYVENLLDYLTQQAAAGT